MIDYTDYMVMPCGEDNTDAKSGRQDCAVEIKKHFGVEE